MVPGEEIRLPSVDARRLAKYAERGLEGLDGLVLAALAAGREEIAGVDGVLEEVLGELEMG